MDPSEDEATRTPVHDPRVDEPSTYETPEQSRDEGTSRQTPWDTWPGLVAMLMVAGIIFLIAMRRWLRGPPSTSVV